MVMEFQSNVKPQRLVNLTGSDADETNKVESTLPEGGEEAARLSSLNILNLIVKIRNERI